MIIKEVKRDLFSMEDKYHLVHCISSDYKLGAGIAVIFNKKYNMINKLNLKKKKYVFPDVILIDNVFNLVTKERYWDKPTYKNFEITLKMLREEIDLKNIKHIAMPKIGCGLDGLSWMKVRDMILNIFGDTDLEIIVCYI